MAETIVEWFGGGPASDCGYCKSKDTNISDGMWAHRMSCEVYESLLNRGWRRSGMYCYKPTMDKTCCPQYTIRCDVTQVKLSKSQKKVLKHVNKYLISGVNAKGETALKETDQSCSLLKTTSRKPDLTNVQSVKSMSMEVVDGSCNENETKEDLPLIENNPDSVRTGTDPVSNGVGGTDPVNSTVSGSDPVNSTVSGCDRVKNRVFGADPNKPKCPKAKERRYEKKLLKLNKNSETSSVKQAKVVKNIEKSIEEYINDLPLDVSHELRLSLINVKNKSVFEATFDEEFALYCKYQHIVHGDAEEDLTEKQFRRFLVDGPLQYVPHHTTNNLEIPTTGLGAFHHQYRLDGKLVAVGVLDILPHCVSSKYFFYDPDYSFLSLGTYSALREIYLIRWLNESCPRLKYYYMGFYLDGCQKMKYKAKYSPSYLLCPETYIWQPVEKCLPKFVNTKYSRLEDDMDKEAPAAPDLNSALILNEMEMLMFKDYMKKLSTKSRLTQAKEIAEYVGLVGLSCHDILLYRS